LLLHQNLWNELFTIIVKYWFYLLDKGVVWYCWVPMEKVVVTLEEVIPESILYT